MANKVPITKAQASRIWKGYKETKAAVHAFIDAGWDVVPESKHTLIRLHLTTVFKLLNTGDPAATGSGRGEAPA